MTKNTTEAIILAGGKGTRLKGILDDRQKTMAIVCGKPFIEWILLSLKKQGVKRAVICTGHLSETVESYFRDKNDIGLEIKFSRENVPLGTAGALRKALDKTNSKQILVLNGDSYFKLDLSGFLKTHIECNAKASIILMPIKDASRYGSVKIGEGGEVLAFMEKTTEEQTGLVNAGAYIFEREIIEKIPEEKKVSLETEIFPDLIGKSLYSRLYEGLFIDIGTPESFDKAEEILSEEFKYPIR